MKREGRQHGVVRTYAILPDPFSQRRHVQKVDSASVSGLFTKVSRKPTNQSKFTGKCGKSGCSGCHIHPASKSRDKAKGTMKLRSIGSDLDVNDYPAAGNSARSGLAYLANDDASYDDIDVYDGSAINGYDYDYSYETNIEYGIGTNEFEDKDEDESMSYYDVGLCWGDGDADVFGDDGWYLVGHTQ